MQDLSILEERIGYKFADRKLLERAVTHRSFAAQHNERLEFLGDSVLNCVVGYALFQRDKHFTEGDLSRVRANLVCERTLAVIAKQIDVSAFPPEAISTATPRSSLLRLGGIVIAISVVGLVTVTASPTASPSVRR